LDGLGNHNAEGTTLRVSKGRRFRDIFVSSWERQDHYSQLEKLQYKGNFREFLLSAKDHNLYARVTGLPWQRLLLTKVPVGIRERLSMAIDISAADIADVTFERELEKAARLYELFTESERAMLKPQSSNTTNSRRQPQGRSSSEGNNTASGQGSNQSKRKRDKPSSGRRGDNLKGSSKDERRWKPEEKDKALQGIPEKVRKERMEKDQCTRCGMTGHRWSHCRR